MSLCLLTALCICFCAFWPLPVFGCASAAALIAGVSRRNPGWRFRTLCKLSPSLPLRCPVWSTTKHKYKNTWMWNTIWLLSTFHNAMSLNWPMGDGYRLWLWNKTLQETDVFLEFWSDMSPIIVATKGRVRLPNRMNFRKKSKQPLTLPPLIFGKLCLKFFFS